MLLAIIVLSIRSFLVFDREASYHSSADQPKPRLKHCQAKLDVHRDVGTGRLIGVEYRKGFFIDPPKELAVESAGSRCFQLFQLLFRQRANAAEQVVDVDRFSATCAFLNGWGGYSTSFFHIGGGNGHLSFGGVISRLTTD
jgi:hypothetical protein